MKRSTASSSGSSGLGLADVFKKYNPDQPREPQGVPTGGRWTAAGGEQLNTLLAGGGFTLDRQGNSVTTGNVVSPYKSRERRVPASAWRDDPAKANKDVRSFLEDNDDLLQRGDHFFGGWHDTKTDEAVLDVVIVVPTDEEAARIGKENDQDAYFNLDRMEEIRLKYDPNQPRDPAGTSTGGQWTGSAAEAVPAFMDRFRAETEFSGSSVIGHFYPKENSVASITLRPYPDEGRVHLVSLIALEPRQGGGTKAMHWLTKLADEHQVKLTLDAEPFGPNKMPKSKLVKFYQSFGFTRVNRSYAMERKPKAREKFDPAQPRVPAGESEGGQWTAYGGGKPVTLPEVPAEDAFLAPLRGSRMVKGTDTPAFLVYPEGHPLAGKPVPFSFAALPPKAQDKIRELAKQFGMTEASIQFHINGILDDALARYAQHPELETQDKFYEQWNEQLRKLADETGISFERVTAAASAISPSVKAENNLPYAVDMAQRIAANDLVPENVRSSANALIAATHEADPSTKDVLSFVPKGAHILDLNTATAVRTMQVWKQTQEGVGFQSPYGYLAFNKAFDVLSERSTPNSTLNGVKLRSFYNNIIDPEGSGRRGDVTVDFHMIDAARGNIGTDAENQKLVGGVSLYGISLGVRPMIADAVRAAGVVHDLPAYRVQEIIWAEWRRQKVRSK